jgi:rod shape-determining protein MreC
MRRLTFVFIASTCMAVVYYVVPWRHVWDRMVCAITYPLLATAHTITKPIHTMLYAKRHHENLEQAVHILCTENEELREENIKLHATLNYQQRSSDLAEFQQRYGMQGAIKAKVLLKNFSDDEHFFLINRGERDGITTNMVALYKFQLLGKVIDVFPSYSKVLLISDKKCTVGAITNKGNHPGMVMGTGVLNRCSLDHISHLYTVTTGDLVLSSGQGTIFPEGFCLGKIGNGETKNLCHRFDIHPLVDFRTVDFCWLTGQEKIPAF